MCHRAVSGTPAEQLVASTDVQLPVACTNLLFALAASSRSARQWLVAPAGGLSTVQRYLVSTLHPAAALPNNENSSERVLEAPPVYLGPQPNLAPHWLSS